MIEVGVTHLTPQEVFKPESVGVPFARNLCKIVDVETGTVLGPNTPGELVVQSPQVLYGILFQFNKIIADNEKIYIFDNSEATKATIKDG